MRQCIIVNCQREVVAKNLCGLHYDRERFRFTRADSSTYTLCAVYVPTNHLYVGDVVVLPEDDVIDTDLTVEDGVSIILSAGSSMPSTVAEK